MIEEPLLSIREVIDILNVSRPTLNQWIEKGKLSPVRKSGMLRFCPEDVRAVFEEEGSASPSGRVLIIDDDPLVGRSLQLLLEQNGYEARIASLGLEALDLASSECFDLIITDIRMPGMNGMETLQAIRRMQNHRGRPQLPEIVITAFDEEAFKKEIRDLGVRDLILKPFEIGELLGALERNLPRPPK